MQAVASQPPVVYIVGEPKAVIDVRLASPSTFVGYRSGRIATHGPLGEGIPLPESLDECYQAGRRRFEVCWPEYAGLPAHAFSLFNEWLSKDNANLMARGCRAYQGAMDAARGKCKIFAGDLNTGQPEITADIRVAMAPMLEQAQGEGHPLNIHWYARKGDLLYDPANHGLRWTRLGHYPKLKVVVGEYAAYADDMPTGEGFIRLLREGDLLYAPWRGQVMGLCLFTLIGQRENQWARYNFESELWRYKNHLATFRLVEPPM